MNSRGCSSATGDIVCADNALTLLGMSLRSLQIAGFDLSETELCGPYIHLIPRRPRAFTRNDLCLARLLW